MKLRQIIITLLWMVVAIQPALSNMELDEVHSDNPVQSCDMTQVDVSGMNCELESDHPESLSHEGGCDHCGNCCNCHTNASLVGLPQISVYVHNPLSAYSHTFSYASTVPLTLFRPPIV